MFNFLLMYCFFFQGPGFDRMGEAYDTLMNNFANAEKNRNTVGLRYVQLAKYL